VGLPIWQTGVVWKASDQVGLAAGPSGSGHHTLQTGCKTKSQKRHEQEAAKDATGEILSNNSIMHNLVRPNTHTKLVDHFMGLPRATTTVNPGARMETRLSAMDVSPLPLPAFQLHDDILSSASSLLQPPTHNNNLLSMSSHGSKRC
jgi:hypothetical protein